MRTLAVVGGGVIGLSIAWRAAESGWTVTLFDPAIGAGASWVAGGMLAPLSEGWPGEDAALEFGAASLARWPAFAARLTAVTGIELFTARETLTVALDSADAADLRTVADWVNAHELPGFPDATVAAAPDSAVTEGVSLSGGDVIPSSPAAATASAATSGTGPRPAPGAISAATTGQPGPSAEANPPTRDGAPAAIGTPGTERLRLLDRAGIRAAEPGLGRTVRAGLLAADEPAVDNRALVAALRSACARAGVEFRTERIVAEPVAGDTTVAGGRATATAENFARGVDFAGDMNPARGLDPATGVALADDPESAAGHPGSAAGDLGSAVGDLGSATGGPGAATDGVDCAGAGVTPGALVLRELPHDRIVLAAGAASAELWPGLPVRPVKGEILRLRRRPSAPPQPRHVIRARVHGRPIYLVPRGDGIVLGATQYEAGFDTAVTVAGVRDLITDAEAIFPGIGEYEFAEATAGSRPGSPDNLPLIGYLDERVIAATGHGRNGILGVPVTADAVVELLAGSVLPAARAADPGRFTRSGAQSPRSVPSAPIHPGGTR